MVEDSNFMWLISLIAVGIALLQLPSILSNYRRYLDKKLSNYNRKEKIILTTSITSIGLAFALGILAVLEFVNSIPMLVYIQTQPVDPITYAFQDLMMFGVISGIFCSVLGYNLLRTNWKELRVILSPKSF